MKFNNEHQSVDLLAYYFISCVVLIVSGMVFKAVFVVYNYQQFSGLGFTDIVYALVWGLRFDLASAAVFSLISCIILWLFHRLSPARNPATALLLVMIVVQLSLQISDTMYFAESGRHVSYEMRDVMKDASGLFMTAITKHLVFVILAYLLVFVIIFLALDPARKALSFPLKGIRLGSYRGQPEVGLFSILLLSIIIVRGGISGVPQSVISAFKIGNPDQAIIAMNGAYSVVYGVLNSSKEITRVAVNLPENTDVNTIMRTLYPDAGVARFNEEPAPKELNLVFILMEGWPADVMASYGYDKVTTPFFDSLKEKALAPRGVISGGVRTTEGIYAIFCSQQNPLGKTVAQSSLQNNQYDCLPNILKRQGWHTAFFQGSHKETSGTGAFAQSLGFTDSFAKEDMPEGKYEHNYWGAHDPDIYDFALSQMDSMPQPFMIGLNTNSTHDVKLPDGVKPLFNGNSYQIKRQNILHFADQSLQGFFEKIKDKPYYKNTIFVLLSDHTGGKHRSIAQRYFIPGIIYAENLVVTNKLERYVSQRDFSPTVLDVLDLPPAKSFTGSSFYSESNNNYFADYFHSGVVGWITGDLLVETSVTNPSDINCYSLERGLMQADAVTCDAVHKSKSLQSLVFTSYSQDLLFTGKTKSFYQFLDNTVSNNEEPL